MMNRKSQNQNSTERILKSKYLEKDKQKTIPLNYPQPRKVMLTDLCPEEKLKVGELIKINETRKVENQQLAEELNEIRMKFAECQSRLIQLEEEFGEKELQCEEMQSTIEQLEEKTVEQEISSNKLQMELKYYRDAYEKTNIVTRQNRGVQTQQQSKADICIQTKRIKTKNREIQADFEPQIEIKSQLFRPHSKSFQKVMKERQTSLKNSISRSQNEIAGSEKNSYKNEDQEDYVQNSINRSPEEVEQECFDELAKKWLSLKEKKIAKLKTQYQQSKAKIVKESFEDPKQFEGDEEQVAINTEKDSNTNDIDQMQLNKMLKSKNFSASRLLNSKGILAESTTSRKVSANKQQQQQQSKFQQKKASFFNYQANPNRKLNILGNPKKGENMTLQQIQNDPREKRENRQNRHINFYESDIMDIVDSL